MIIANIQPISLLDFEEKISVVIFTQGCNFRCYWCHNQELIPKGSKTTVTEEEVFKRLDRPFVDALCITGGEPTLQPDIVEFCKRVKNRYDKLIKIDTNGSNPKTLEKLLDIVDYVAMDVKAPLDRYDKVTGIPVLTSKILESIELIKSKASNYEFRTTAIPELGTEDYKSIKQLVRGAKRYVLQAYRKEVGKICPSKEQLEEWAKIIEPVVNNIRITGI